MKRTLSVLLAFVIFVLSSVSVSVTVYADYAGNLTAHQKIDVFLQNYVDPNCHLDKYTLAEAEEAELLAVAEEVTADCTTAYEKISAITEFVAKEIYYDYDYYEDRTTTLFYEPYEVWTNKRTVCEGYARLTKEFLNLINIPCMCIRASNHLYNSAYDVENDRWIYLDTTWCSGNKYKYEEFISGSYKPSRFDMSLETLASLSNHEVYGLSGIVFDDIKYAIETPKDATDWSNLDEWKICVAGVTDDFDSTVVDILGSFEGLEVKIINESAFYGCSTITAVTMPEGLVRIKYRAFGDCTNLTSVTFPDSLTTIDNTVFLGCTSLVSISIPDSVNDIGGRIFEGCVNLTSVNLSANMTTLGFDTFYDCTSLTSVTIPENVTKIGSGAFQGCTGLTSVTIPNKVTNIGSEAFRGCTSLASVTIPNSVTNIESSAFRGCTSLTSITIPNSVTTIGDYAFGGCTGFTSVVIPDSVTKIGSSAFRDCVNITSVIIPDSVTSLEQYTFRGCTGLTSFTLPEGITNIGFGSFYNCTNLTSISIPDSVTKIDSYAFSNCYKLETIDIPKNVTSIGMYAFRSCTDLSEVEIPEGVTLIDYGAFQSCVGLSKVSIPDSVLTIDDYAFRHCALKSVVIPKNVTTLGDYVFQGCGGLKKVVMYNSLTSIGVEAVTSPSVIYCYENTTAQSYAVENGISYIPIQLSSAKSEVSVDFNNRIVFSSLSDCTDIEELVSTSSGCTLNANASLSVGNTKCYGTGSGVAITIDGIIVDEYAVVVEGDINGDGAVDALDAAQTNLAINGFREFNDLQIYAANGCVSDTIDVASYQNVVNKVLSD